ncbi:hypothetical protein PT2222_20378 [Paraburkholderia tropica]
METVRPAGLDPAALLVASLTTHRGRERSACRHDLDGLISHATGRPGVTDVDDGGHRGRSAGER